MRNALSLAALLVCALPASGIADAAEPIPPAPASESIYLETGYLFVEGPEVYAYVESVMDKLLQGRTEKFERPRLLIHSSNEFDARMDENGSLLLSTEALRALQSEDELAALLGHELAHVVMAHPAKKSLLQRFPVGVQTMSAIAAAGDRLVQSHKQKSDTLVETEFSKRRLQNNEDLSEFWGDFLAPSWNRKQESEADMKGLDMMLAAGYDPAAFATFFSRLQASQLERGKRMDALREELMERARAASAKKAATTQQAATPVLTNALKGLADGLSEKAIKGLFDAVAKMSADYDSPEQRKEAVAKHVATLGRRDKTPRSPLFAKNLREGPGGALLRMDGAALKLSTSLRMPDEAAAREALAVLLPAPPTPTGKKKTAAPTKAPPVSRPVSPHLNQALVKWFEHVNDWDVVDQRLAEWVEYPRAPASVFVSRAQGQSARAQHDAAVATLDDGARRIGTPGSFLPTMVAVARDAKNVPGAQEYVRRCDQEEQKRKSAADVILGVFKADPLPIGLYAECLVQLGDIPPPQDGKSSKPGLLDMSKAVNGLREPAKK